MRRIVSLMMVLALLLALAGCSMPPSSKTVLSADEFAEKMEAEGFEVADVTDQFEAGSVETVLIAFNDDYQLEFYVLESDARASEAFAGNKEYFESISSNSNAEVENAIGNYEYYSRTTSDGYYVVSRVDNTFLYIEEEADEKDAIVEYLKLLGY